MWFFFIYAFIGWCTEVVYAAVESGEFVNRGFLNGPLCPIYGVGMLLVIHLLQPVQDNLALMFVGALLITSGIELIGGFVLEKAFHHRWWDYSDMPFNIGGYVCLMFSLAWGLACLVAVDRIHPLIVSLVDVIPLMASQILLIVLGSLLVVDSIATVKAILKLNQKLEIIDEISLKIREASDSIGENLANGAIALVQTRDDLEGRLEEGLEVQKELLAVQKEKLEVHKEKLEADLAEIRRLPRRALEHEKLVINDLYRRNRELLETSHFGQKRLLKAFPGLRSVKHKDALEKMRRFVLNGWDKLENTNENHEQIPK